MFVWAGFKMLYLPIFWSLLTSSIKLKRESFLFYSSTISRKISRKSIFSFTLLQRKRNKVKMDHLHNSKNPSLELLTKLASINSWNIFIYQNGSRNISLTTLIKKINKTRTSLRKKYVLKKENTWKLSANSTLNNWMKKNSTPITSQVLQFIKTLSNLFSLFPLPTLKNLQESSLQTSNESVRKIRKWQDWKECQCVRVLRLARVSFLASWLPLRER